MLLYRGIQQLLLSALRGQYDENVETHVGRNCTEGGGVLIVIIHVQSFYQFFIGGPGIAPRNIFKLSKYYIIKYCWSTQSTPLGYATDVGICNMRHEH